MKKLSIITICFNEKDKIKKTIESVVSQNFSDFEYLVIDGGSSDRTAEIIAQYKNRFAYFVSEKDGGIYNAMNKGIEHSTGEYLLFLNGGDYLYNNDVLKKIFSEGFNEDIVYGDMILENSLERKSFKDVIINDRYLFSYYLPHPASFIKKDLFMKYGYYNEDYKIVGDYEFFLRVIKKYKATVKYIFEIVSVYNNDGISSNPKYFKLQLQERRRAQKKYFNFIFLFKMLLLKIKRILFKLSNKN